MIIRLVAGLTFAIGSQAHGTRLVRAVGYLEAVYWRISFALLAIDTHFH